MDELIAAYGDGLHSDESREESEEGDEDVVVPQKKRRIVEEPRERVRGVGNETDVHAGKIRSFEHVAGSFPTHVFIPLYPCHAARVQLESLVARICEVIPGLRSMEEVCTESGRIGLHLSLSRTCPTRRLQHSTILQGLTKQLRRQPEWAPVSAVEFDAEHPIVLSNDDRTRTFVCLQLHASMTSVHRHLNAFVSAVDGVFRQHALQTYHVNPVHHISIAWMPGDVVESLRRKLNEQWRGATRASGARPRWAANAGVILCRIGRKDNCVLGIDKLANNSVATAARPQRRVS